ncbi:hypothetical protein ACLB2K_050204 [Fragaria x ananassa]
MQEEGKSPTITPLLAAPPIPSLKGKEVVSSFVASLVLANLKVVNLSDHGFAPPKKKRRHPISSRNRKGKKKMQEEETIVYDLPLLDCRLLVS